MAHIAGIKSIPDALGVIRYLRIDLKKHGNNPFLEDFLDSLDIEKRKGEKTVPLDNVIERQKNRKK